MLMITQTALELGFLYALVAMALFLSFRILNIADMTTDGCFVLGAAVSVTLAAGGHPILAIPAAMLAGSCAGFVTAFLQTRLGIPSILAGIVTNTGLYTINLIVMGSSPNISLINVPTIFKAAESLGLSKEAARLVIAIAAAAVCLVLLILFFRTHLGLCIRATGDNEAMVSASSINVDAMKITALAFSNALVAVSGGLIAQYQGFADVNSGSGMLVVGLASVIIGEVIVGKRGLEIGFFSSIFGSIIYRYIIAAATKSQIFPAYALKLVSACIVAAALALPAIRYQMGLSKMKRTREKDMYEQ